MHHESLSTEKCTTPSTTDNSLSPSIKWHENSKFCLIFKGICLKQKDATYATNYAINVFIVYELDFWPRDLDSDFTLKISLWYWIRYSYVIFLT